MSAAASGWLTPRRLRAQGIALALCLWSVCIVDFSSSGMHDRGGNIKFQDFLPAYVSARLLADHRADELYKQQTIAQEIQKIVPKNSVQLPNLYGPQVALVFLPLACFSFLMGASIWVGLSLGLYGACIASIWRFCPNLRPYPGLAAIAAAAFVPLFHFFVRGQNSALALACFSAAFLALRAGRAGLAGLALGCLIFKPQFVVAIPLILLLARAWKLLAGLIVSATAQLALAWLYSGTPVMRAYFDTLVHAPRWLSSAELSLAPIQMHSLRSFWMLLIPWPSVALILYIFTAIATIALAAIIWKSSLPLAVRFSVLTLAAVLVSPHLFVYDLLVLAPALLLLTDWTLVSQEHPNRTQWLLYLCFVLPLVGPLSRWTHVQLTVPIFAMLLWTIHRASTSPRSRRFKVLSFGHNLDSVQPRDV